MVKFAFLALTFFLVNCELIVLTTFFLLIVAYTIVMKFSRSFFKSDYNFRE